MSAIRRWTLRTDPMNTGEAFWFYIYIYETPEDLRKAARKYRNDDQDFSDTLGCFQPQITSRFDRKGKPVHNAKTQFIGCMRLSRPHMQQFIIVHESVHAAINLARAVAFQDGRSEPDFDDIEVEEYVAHATHQISRAIMAKARMRS